MCIVRYSYILIHHVLKGAGGTLGSNHENEFECLAARRGLGSYLSFVSRQQQALSAIISKQSF